MAILRGELSDDLCQVVSLVEYHPYRVQGQRNPKADQYTHLIMDLKGGNPRKQESAIDHFAGMLAPCVEKGIVLTAVPSHDPDRTATGIRTLAQRLAANGRVDGTSCLVRHKMVRKKAGGGPRGLSIDLDSIRVEHAGLVKDRYVLLLDDVVTTGYSLMACVQLLEQAGAVIVQRLALGRTTHERD